MSELENRIKSVDEYKWGKVPKSDKEIPVEGYEHSDATRTNNPPAGLAHLDREETPSVSYSYDPNLDPQLNWTGKAERQSFEIPAPSIHVHEELSAKNILAAVRKNRLDNFIFNFEDLDSSKSVEFYEHEMSWTNRLILGDSLIVMNSLLTRERMAGTVQAVYMDPPYGIKYNSNFQPRMGDTDVKDRSDEDLTREPEMIQAYRDTWELGVHSYLTHMRDRLTVARELLAEKGSIFVQISEENVHRLRVLLDEVFGTENFVSMISYVTTSGFAQAKGLGRSGDYILWYAKDKSSMKVNSLWFKNADRGAYTNLELADGSRRPMTKSEKDGSEPIPEGSRIYRIDNATSQGAASQPQPFEFEGKVYFPGRNTHWKASYPEGMNKLAASRRLRATDKSISYIRYADDFGYQSLTNLWSDTIVSFALDKRYVVQTSTKVVERCLQLVTEPGDLVLDPTCGSGTTAVVAEQWGRRWITIDTSRVSTSIARERLLTAVFPSYELADEIRGIDAGLKYTTVKRVTLGSIANSESPEEIALVDQPVLNPKKTRVSGPFTFEALSRYAMNPFEDTSEPRSTNLSSSDHISQLLDALRTSGIPRVGGKPHQIQELEVIEGIGAIQAHGVADFEGKPTRFGVSIGPKFGPITIAQVQEALTASLGYNLIVFAGFAVSPDAAEKLSTGKIGASPVSLLLANPDLLLGDLLKNTKTSQTFKLYSAPDVRIEKVDQAFSVTIDGVDTFDAATGDLISLGKSGIKAWMLDTDYDSQVFRATQAFFPDSDGWSNLRKALRSSVDSEVLEQLSGWTSAPFEKGDSGKIAVRVVTQDGNSSEVVLSLD
jgi:adenine-specific DNA-methyltransferase